MKRHPLRHFQKIYCLDFEYFAPDGDNPRPICLVAREVRTGELLRLWLDGGDFQESPLPSGPDILYVAYYSAAEWSCYLSLGWPLPSRVLDLYAEFRCIHSGMTVSCGYSLLGALAHYALDSIEAIEKDRMRALAMRGGPYTEAEQQELLDYCQSDVDALVRLLSAMTASIDVPRALLRGRYMVANARIVRVAIPIDMELYERFAANWTQMKCRITGEIDKDYNVFEPADRRTINPKSSYGSALLSTSKEFDVNPYDLADAVETVFQEERESLKDIIEARKSARKATGLTPRRIAALEKAGHDHTNVFGIDVIARELAGQYPALDIGQGYVNETNYDGLDHGAMLWDCLREDDPRIKPRYHPDILKRGAEWVQRYSDSDTQHYGPLRFSTARFTAYLARMGIQWPVTETGAIALDRDTFREMARVYPNEIGPLKELLQLHRGELKKLGLTVGSDGRNRYMLSAFGSSTSRNQPSNTASIFGPAAWLRFLIKPPPGRAIAYVDWAAQELAIAGALSGDIAMQRAYESGDPYLWLAKAAGAVPQDATKDSHSTQRDQFKIVMLGVLYGLSDIGIARKLGIEPCRGRELLHMHMRTFEQFWRWSDAVEAQAILSGKLRTVFGWQVHAGPNANPRSLRNFPMQANGAEMMRLACCMATEQGIAVCAPVHDALMVEGAVEDIDEVVRHTQDVMREAGKVVLNGFELRTDAKIVRYPDRYTDKRGQVFFERVCGLLDTLEPPAILQGVGDEIGA